MANHLPHDPLLASRISWTVDNATHRLAMLLGVLPDAPDAAQIIRDAVNAGVDLGAGFMRAEYDGAGVKMPKGETTNG